MSFTSININQARDTYKGQEDSKEDQVDWGDKDMNKGKEFREKGKVVAGVGECTSNNYEDDRRGRQRERERGRLPLRGLL